MLKVFVEDGECDIWMHNADGWLPLHIAVYLGYMDIVCYLLQFQLEKTGERCSDLNNLALFM